MGKTRAKGKIKISAVTAISPTYSDAFTTQLKKQQQQFEALVGKVQAIVTTLQAQKCPGHILILPEEPFIGNEG